MRRNRRNDNGRERMIMIFSSAFVLAALTMSGLYLRNKETKIQNDGYNMDFSALENNAPTKPDEVAESGPQIAFEVRPEAADRAEETADLELEENTAASSTGVVNPGLGEQGTTNLENDLDYMPLDADNHMVEIIEDNLIEEDLIENDIIEDEISDTNVIDSDIEVSGLVRPVSGEILLPYSMDKSIYFATLDQYKYNPAVIFRAEEGYSVLACSEARVIDIYEDAEIGRAIRLDLGNGYEAIYGQMQEISVVENGHVNAGDILGTIAAPTKYYSMEGCNLYFSLTKDGDPVDPNELFW